MHLFDTLYNITVCRVTTPKTPTHNWENSWGGETGTQSYQLSPSLDQTINMKNSSSSEKCNVQEKKGKEKKSTWDNKWGDDELWESLNK